MEIASGTKRPRNDGADGLWESLVSHREACCRPAERVKLVLGDASAVPVAVHVNGALARHIPWRAANGLDLTSPLRAGENEIGIEVVGSPRNMLGPLHQKAGYLPWTDWRSFRRQGGGHTPEHVLQPYGLFGQGKVVRRG